MASLNSGGGPVGPGGFLFRVETLNIEGALLGLGIGVFLVARLCFLVRFSDVTRPPKEPPWNVRRRIGPWPKKDCSLPLPVTEGSTRNPEFQPTGTARHDRSRRS